MLWSAEEMLDGQRQRVDIPAHARAAHKGLLQKRLEEDLCLIILHPPHPHNLVGQGAELNHKSVFTMVKEEVLQFVFFFCVQELCPYLLPF